MRSKDKVVLCHHSFFENGSVLIALKEIIYIGET